MTFLLRRSLSWVRWAASRLGAGQGLGWAGLFLAGLMSGVLFGVATGVPVTEGFAAPGEENKRLRGEASSIMALKAPDIIVPGVPTELIPVRPRIAIVIDDLGHSWEAFRAVNDLPKPVTLSFLPYSAEAQSMVDGAAPGHEVMLHLPMEPLERVEHAGPDMLVAGATIKEVAQQLEKNLSKLSGYTGVNNHTGSKFTADRAGMELVLAELDRRGLYFLDSVTTNRPVAHRIGTARGYDVFERNVFLDHDYETVSQESVSEQLAELEAIARADGYAIGIGHPYKATVGALTEWMKSAEARGFEIVLMQDLLPPEEPQTLAQLR